LPLDFGINFLLGLVEPQRRTHCGKCLNVGGHLSQLGLKGREIHQNYSRLPARGGGRA
jgi:hypothetical protein